MEDQARQLTDEAAADAAVMAAPMAGAPPADETADEPKADFTFFELLATVPAVIRNYLVSKDITKKREEIYAKFGLNEEERTLALYSELEVFFGDCPLDDLPDRLFARMPWPDEDEEKVRKLSLEIYGRILLPAQAFLGDVVGAIKKFGGDANAYPQDMLELRIVPYKAGAEEIVNDAAPAELDADMRRRLEHIVESRLRNVRDDGDTKEMLMKAKKTGGMELQETTAIEIIDAIRLKTRMTKYVEALEEKEEGNGEQGQSAAAPARLLTAAEIKKIYGGNPEEQQAIMKRVKRFRDVTKNDTAAMRDAYYQVLYPPDERPTDPLYVIAGLLAFAEDGELEMLLTEDARYREIVSKYYTETESGKARAEDFNRFQNDFKDPAAMNLFLQMLLRGFAGLDEAESARFGLRLANTLKRAGQPEYAGLTVFDMEKGAFRWVKPVPFD
ncbi:MAG TPA: hypothetical protein VL500_00330 [Candidatus Eisenbacteria bacterium]|jgi:hypothetical protein|nr:hypothetical protein [Candidatus Eisenbacteria bacterium]